MIVKPSEHSWENLATNLGLCSGMNPPVPVSEYYITLDEAPSPLKTA
jgi:hypothetical protein